MKRNLNFGWYFSLCKGKDESKSSDRYPKNSSVKGGILFSADSLQNRVRGDPSSEAGFHANVNEESKANLIFN